MFGHDFYLNETVNKLISELMFKVEYNTKNEPVIKLIIGVNNEPYYLSGTWKDAIENYSIGFGDLETLTFDTCGIVSGANYDLYQVDEYGNFKKLNLEIHITIEKILKDDKEYLLLVGTLPLNNALVNKMQNDTNFIHFKPYGINYSKSDSEFKNNVMIKDLVKIVLESETRFFN